jgi:hypothetical protein
MKLKKKEINEIITGDGELIGAVAIPTNGSDLETQAKGTSSKNAKIGTQPFRYDMLGRFGFTLMPFMEGEDKNPEQQKLFDDLVDLMNQRYVDLLGHYYRNPNDVKLDYRKYSKEKEVGEEAEKYSKDWAEKIIGVVQKHFEDVMGDESDTIDEGKVIAEKMVDKKEDEMAEKSEDKELRDKKIKKIAGLINKLEKKDIDDLINLIERKDG